MTSMIAYSASLSQIFQQKSYQLKSNSKS
uniref:Uncharacterized protein n=1 Tax=Rhizophora mucronata TaxID=61149 RepID=A0A2P2PFG6_RHIMU